MIVGGARRIYIGVSLQTPPLPATSDVTRHKRSAGRELVEVAVAYALLEGALWSYGEAQALWALAVAGWISAGTVLSRRSPRELGITRAGFRPSAWVVAAAALLGSLFALLAWLNGSLRSLEGVHPLLWHALLYGLWALIQEFIAQSFIYVRLEAAFNSRVRAILYTGLLFSAAHIPNPVLLPGTLVLGICLAWVFSRYRNIYTIAVAHAVLGLTLAVTLPAHVLHNMRVGIAYWLPL